MDTKVKHQSDEDRKVAQSVYRLMAPVLRRWAKEIALGSSEGVQAELTRTAARWEKL